IEIGVPDLVLGIDAALALALDAQLERPPAHAHIELALQLEARIERQIGIGALVVGVHPDFGALVLHWVFRVKPVIPDGSMRAEGERRSDPEPREERDSPHEVPDSLACGAASGMTGGEGSRRL